MSHKVIYFGTPHFAVPALEALIADPRYDVLAVVTQPDKPAGRGKRLTPSPVKIAAEAAGIPVLQPENLGKEWEQVKTMLLNISPIFDVGVVCAFGQILRSSCLEFPLKGCINIHASLLPRWRGAAPIQRAIIAGDITTGISLMQMDTGLDTGDWYVQREIPITATTTGGSLHDQLADLGATLLQEELNSILLGELPSHKQDDSLANYAHKISKEECLISWDESAEAIDRLVRAMSPFPGAYTFLGGNRVKILRGRPVEAFQGQAAVTPGKLSHVGQERLEVSCGTGIYSIERLQMAGRSAQDVRPFLQGIALEPGMQLTTTA